MRVAILGSTGMLGSALTRFLTSSSFEVWEFNRLGNPLIRGNNAKALDVTSDESLETFLKFRNFDFVLNGIGLIKQLIKDESADLTKLAFKVNSDFPAILNDYSQETSTPVIQIGTDCVYSGKQGMYNESSIFDCDDVYGLSKAQGENRSKSLMTLRCSIVGLEVNSAKSLMGWFVKLKPHSQINGFINHLWNGVTTLDFSKIVAGIMASGTFQSGTTHVIPADQVSKYQLLVELQRAFARQDVLIRPFEDEKYVNRTLSTLNSERNSKLWLQAGYDEVPNVHEMVQNYALWIR